MVSVRINGEEVRNPVLRLLLSIGVFLVMLLVLGLVFLIFLPLVWFAALLALSVVTLLLSLGPRIVRNYRIVVIEKKEQAPSQRDTPRLPD